MDMYNTKRMGTQKLVCELTIKGSKVVYDLNGTPADLWGGSEALRRSSAGAPLDGVQRAAHTCGYGSAVPAVYAGGRGD